jgi:hypothetical protein
VVGNCRSYRACRSKVLSASISEVSLQRQAKKIQPMKKRFPCEISLHDCIIPWAASGSGPEDEDAMRHMLAERMSSESLSCNGFEIFFILTPPFSVQIPF